MNKHLAAVLAVWVSRRLHCSEDLARAARPRPTSNGCPAGTSSFTDQWLLVRAGDESVRLADSDGDGSVCVARVVVRGRVLATVFTDNAIGNPNIIPPGPCTNPFESFEIGNPRIFPGTRDRRERRRHALRDPPSLEARGLIIILLDNPNAVIR